VFFLLIGIGQYLQSATTRRRATEMENDKENIHAIAFIRQLDFHLGAIYFVFIEVGVL